MSEKKNPALLFFRACISYLIILSTLSVFDTQPETISAQDRTSAGFGSIAKKLKKTYDQNLFKLEPRVQGHYAIRMWRITTDSSYLNSILFHYLVLKEQFTGWTDNLDSEQYRLSFADSLLAEKFKTDKGKIRKRLLEKRREFLFSCELLETAYQLHSLGMDKAQLASQFQRVRNYLGRLDFRNFLLNPEIVKFYAPQAVNYAYYLKFLGIIDLDSELEAMFRRVFAPADDSDLNEIEYENKIYGLTHFIIAGSDYYQNYVSEERYGWILEYFAKNLDEILHRSKPDVIAEVGLCFKLCGRKNHPAVASIQQRIIESFDPKQGLIPPRKGKADLNKSEHRNIIAFLLLTNFDQLYPGPDLTSFLQFSPSGSLRPED